VVVEAFKPEIQKLLRRLCENVPREEENILPLFALEKSKAL
jgi:hypothetical protein